MKNIRITIEYDGTRYAGWQRQSGDITTIQGELESVLSRIMQEEIRIDGAGRTDSGVHARAQVATFSTLTGMEMLRVAHSANSLLSPDVRITGIEEVPPSFHARFDAMEREYRYFLIERPSALHRRFSGCSHGVVDRDAMNSLAEIIRGAHDFSAFSKEDPQCSNHICNVRVARWYRHRDFLVLRITADRFLRSMVRFLVTAMISAGKGQLAPEEFSRMLQSGVRSSRQVPAEASGLFLWDVLYPSATFD
jgi:tRNA pseudouridine38-40 synthase